MRISLGAAVFSFLVLFLAPISVQAAVVSFTHDGFLQNSEGGYYGYSDSVFDFEFEVDDVGAEYANVYFCANFSTCDVVTTATVPLVAGVGSASIDMSTVSLSYPFGASYIALVVRDAGEAYITEYSLGSYFSGGFVLTVFQEETTGSQITYLDWMVVNLVIIFFLSLMAFHGIFFSRFKHPRGKDLW